MLVQAARESGAMLKPILLLVGLVVAVALLAPDYLSRLAERRETAAVATPAETPAHANDHGGLVRLAADRNGHYFTNVEIDNRNLNALVDTGASVVALRYEDARSLGLVFPGDKFDARVRTANGEGRAKRVQLRSVSIGAITIHDVDALVLEEGAIGVNLLGMSFLRKLSRFEVQRGELVLER
ncbi:MAG: TIGR02281 family clan AA aspartic protease [Bradyrhizobiaceae bacterium]|nr:TIGR02281 family clan AA aspartic protease [Bradyrhizobiaceae bacterium]